MKVENYQKQNIPNAPKLIATFDVATEKMIVRGLKVISGGEGKPWFVGLPSLKSGEQWKPYVEFVNSSHQTAFLQKAREAVESYVHGKSSTGENEDIPF